MGDVVLMVEDLKSASAIAISLCRICHEGEFESCKSLEAPCACSGTVKFAHRDCVQRWCNEKGNTVCEICLQKFEPGYTAPPVKAASQLVDAVVTIRGSLEVPRTDTDIPNPESSASAAEAMLETDCPECSFQANRRFTYCRTMALLHPTPRGKKSRTKKQAKESHMDLLAIAQKVRTALWFGIGMEPLFYKEKYSHTPILTINWPH